ncbi:unnamed protein product, partial [Coccothraustes coccothraustes]
PRPPSIPEPEGPRRALARSPQQFLLVFSGQTRLQQALKLRATMCRAGQQRANSCT